MADSELFEPSRYRRFEAHVFAEGLEPMRSKTEREAQQLIATSMLAMMAESTMNVLTENKEKTD